MKVAELAEQLKCPEEYLLYLKSILDGTEGERYSSEDEQSAIELEEQLGTMEMDD